MLNKNTTQTRIFRATSVLEITVLEHMALLFVELTFQNLKSATPTLKDRAFVHRTMTREQTNFGVQHQC